ncbi:MAG: FkbM family methyltransferase [Chitinivibrionia bacterium]|nr:FkbM family methyltransferase [Chitinivibrionia bacterium]
MQKSSVIREIFFPIITFYRKIVLSRIILKYLSSIEQTDEIKDVMNFLRKEPPRLYPYFFTKEYKYKRINIEYSKEKSGYYFLLDNKKLFLKKSFNKIQCQKYIVGLLLDLDKRSPHSYFADDNYIPQKGEIIADVGAAEGIWALCNVDKCDKIYLFECDSEWIESLRATFEDYADKVEIVQSEISKFNSDDGLHITIDKFFAEIKKIDCIKADIEGAEIDMLCGGEKTFTQKVSKVLICAYHNYDDEKNIKNYLAKYGFTDISTTKGYMLHGISRTSIKSGKAREPYISRGLVLGRK